MPAVPAGGLKGLCWTPLGPQASRLLPWLLLGLMAAAAAVATPPVTVIRPAEGATLDGRLLLMFATDDAREPRFLVGGGVSSAQVFGVDVEGWKAGESRSVDASAFGFPIDSLNQVAAGEYFVQALLHRYETFEVAHGHTLKLPMDRGEGQQWRSAPGNLYSTPVKVSWDPASETALALQLDQVVPPITPPEDTKYIKHVRLRSELLSAFWGRDMYLGAHVLLPVGFAEHPEARYPLVIFHGHHPSDFGGFRTEPPDPDLKPEYSARFGVEGYNLTVQQEAYDFYKTWTSDDFPRFLIVEIQHANPFYDDSYAVNSANVGPYGDAIVHELIPFLEQEFRGLGEGWARFLYGGSTGGWEALAAQVFYPDDFNGCFAACPDPIDFRGYMTTDIYADENAYYEQGPFMELPRPGHRNYLGQVNATIESNNLMELAIGTHGRSGDQFDIWEAVYSPVGEDGYPKRLWDKRTGVIDHEVSEYWRENYDVPSTAGMAITRTATTSRDCATTRSTSRRSCAGSKIQPPKART